MISNPSPPLGLEVAEPDDRRAAIAQPHDRRREQVRLRQERPRLAHVPRPEHARGGDGPRAVLAPLGDALGRLLLRVAGEGEAARPATTTFWSTSSWPNPAPGSHRGGPRVQVARSWLVACAMTPSSLRPAATLRAVTNRCQPSPSGSGRTTGSRHVSLEPSRSGPVVGRRRGVGERLVPAAVDPQGGLGAGPRQWWRSSDTADPTRWSKMWCPPWTAPCRTSASGRRRRTTDPVQMARSSKPASDGPEALAPVVPVDEVAGDRMPHAGGDVTRGWGPPGPAAP